MIWSTSQSSILGIGKSYIVLRDNKVVGQITGDGLEVDRVIMRDTQMDFYDEGQAVWVEIDRE